MHRFAPLAAVALVLLLAAAALAGRWDSQYSLYTTFSAGSSNACASVPGGRYLKVTCGYADGGGADTYLGSGDVTYDGGYCANSADAGTFCDLVRFSLGEKLYLQGKATTNRVCGLGFQGQTSYCFIFVGEE